MLERNNSIFFILCELNEQRKSSKYEFFYVCVRVFNLVRQISMSMYILIENHSHFFLFCVFVICRLFFRFFPLLIHHFQERTILMTNSEKQAIEIEEINSNMRQLCLTYYYYHHHHRTRRLNKNKFDLSVIKCVRVER